MPLRNIRSILSIPTKTKKKKGVLIISSAALLIFLTRETDQLLTEENLDTSELNPAFDKFTMTERIFHKLASDPVHFAPCYSYTSHLLPGPGDTPVTVGQNRGQ